VLLNTHRCGGQIVIAWLNSEKTYITEVGGNTVTLQSEVYDLTNMVRSSVFGVAPATARYCIVVARGQGLGQVDPYLFVKNMYFGQATVAQLDHSPWSPGRAIGQITGANASTYIADAAITNAKIGNFISSADFNGTINTSGNITDVGTTGWAIGKGNGTAGVAVFQNIVARGDIEVPEASISTAKISELAVDGLRIRGGAVTFTAIQELENTWPTSDLADRQIAFIDFSNAAQDGALLKIYVLPTGTTSNAQLHSSRLEVSIDNITWTTLASTAATSATDEGGGVVTVPAVIVNVPGAVRRLAPTTYGAPPRNSWWGTSTRLRALLTELAVWPAGNNGGTVTMQFTMLIPTAGTYRLYYGADDRLDSGNFGTPESGIVSLTSSTQLLNDPQFLTYTTNGNNQVATLNVTCTDTGSLEGFAAYLVPTINDVFNSTVNSIWTVRRPNYTTNVFKYARVVARRYNSFTNPEVTSWLGVEIIRK
jgi:hypothetical protein